MSADAWHRGGGSQLVSSVAVDCGNALLLRRLLRRSDPDQPLGDDYKAADQLVEIVVLREPLEHGYDSVRLLVAQPKQYHAPVSARRRSHPKTSRR